MKKVYERPVMMAEVYETNTYCNACGDVFETGELILNENSIFNRTHNGGNNWGKRGHDTKGYKKEDLYHTFNNNNMAPDSNGICPDNSHQNISQSIWKCTCHPLKPWYLEHSHYYSKHEKGGDTFFLYEEINGNGRFDITPNTTSWPAKNNGTDYNVAEVVFQKVTTEVILS